MKKLALIFLFLCAQLVSNLVVAYEEFTVKDIEVLGLQRISKDTVLLNIPIKAGEKYSDALSAKIIHSVMKLGHFKQVDLERNAAQLVIKVIERPAIGEIVILGIKDKAEVQKILQERHEVAEGRTYSPSHLADARQELEQYYLSKGKYGVRVTTQVNFVERNRVKIEISIYEGEESKIKSIKFVGNQKFSSKELLKILHHTTSHWLSWYTKSDRYAKEKLAADIELLRSFYLDRGYLDFSVESTQVSLSTTMQEVYLTFNLFEGEQYYISNVKLQGDFVNLENEMQQLLNQNIHINDVFSRKVIWDAKQLLENLLGKHGYSKAEVSVSHKEDKDARKASLTFFVKPFKRITVRKISFEGNNLTKDEVLRREIPQLEGTWVSVDKVREGKEQLQRMGYAGQVEVVTIPVEGSDDQVDLLFKVEELKTAQLSAGISYSLAEKFMYNIGADFRNFLGTGKDINFNFDRSGSSEAYSFGYYNPYFTHSGIGMGYDLYKQRVNLSKTSTVFDYATDSVGGSVNWSFRLSQYQFFGINFGYDHTQLKYNQETAPIEAINFSKKVEWRKSFIEYLVGATWKYNSLNSFYFPSKGSLHTVSVKTSAPGSRLKWYRTDIRNSVFYPLYKKIVFNCSAELGYANSYGRTPYPFYRHYFIGGSDSIRGFAERSLGPQSSRKDPFGGNFRVLGRVQLISPPPFFASATNVRTSLFLDGGQVYDTINRRTQDGKSRNPTGLRFSYGVSLQWNTPMQMPLVLSLARPVKRYQDDKLSAFAFSLGTQFW